MFRDMTTSAGSPIKPLTLKDLHKYYEMLSPTYDTVVMNQKTHDQMVSVDRDVFKSYKIIISSYVDKDTIFKINTEKLISNIWSNPCLRDSFNADVHIIEKKI